MLVRTPLPEDDNGKAEKNNVVCGEKTPKAKAKSKPLTPKAPNRWLQLNTFVDKYMSEVPPSSVMLLVFMFRHADPNGYVKIAQKHAAKKIGFTDRTLRTALTWLKANGFVATIHQGGLNRGISRYQLRMPP